MANQAIFVMGATGRVGSAVISSMPADVRVRAAARRAGGDHVQFDLADETTFAGALAGVGAIFLMRPPQITKGSAFVPFLQAARSRNISRVVVLSVAGADTNAILPHHAMEKVVMEMGFDWTMIRPSDFMQNLETVHRDSIRNRNEIAVPAGQGRSSFIDVADIGAVVSKVLLEPGHGGRGYTLTGPVALDFSAVAQILTEALGRPIHYRRVGAIPFLWEQLRGSQPLGISLVMTALYTVQRFGRAAAVTHEVERLLGRQPHTLKHYVERSASLWRV